MPTANCPHCQGTIFSGTFTSAMGESVVLVYCTNCGAVVGAVNKTN